MTESYVKNCIVLPREDGEGPLFKQEEDGDVAIAKLDGYLIIGLNDFAQKGAAEIYKLKEQCQAKLAEDDNRNREA